MDSSSRRDARHRIARLAACAAALSLGCVTHKPARPAASPAPPSPGGLEIELIFGSEADLDLYVSDPLRETAYFANTPVRSGGEHAGDVRCDAPAPRVEVVRWRAPLPGNYRVGVDFPERCEAGVQTARYRLRVTGAGNVRELEGEAHFGRFEPRVLEFQILR